MFSGNSSWQARWRRTRIASVLVLAALVRLLVLTLEGHPELLEGKFAFSPLGDELEYHNIAAALAQSGRYLDKPDGVPTAMRTPGSTVPLAIVYWFFGAEPWMGILLTEVYSLLCVVLVGLLARSAFGSEGAAVAAMATAGLLPSLALFSAGIWSDPPTAFWVLCALYSVQRIEERPDQRRHLILLGLSLAFAYLTRTSSSILVAAVLAWLSFRSLRIRRIRQLAIVCFVAALPVLAWGTRNRLVFGQFFLGSSLQGQALFATNNPVSAGLEPPPMRYRGGFDLYEEAARGMYLGHGLPLDYILAEPPVFDHGPAELEANSFYAGTTAAFLRREPTALVRLIAFKARRLLTAEPHAPSHLRITANERKRRWLVAAIERWTMLSTGFFGLILMYRQGNRYLAQYTVFVSAGIVPVFISAPSARNLLPAMVCLAVPAGLAWHTFVTGLRRRSSRTV